VSPIVIMLWLIAAYGLCGILFAIPFAALGAGRIDAAARHSGLPFRLVIIPGAAALWPFLLLKWVRASRSTPGDHA
jgi:hypothetical protein